MTWCYSFLLSENAIAAVFCYIALFTQFSELNLNMFCILLGVSKGITSRETWMFSVYSISLAQFFFLLTHSYYHVLAYLVQTAVDNWSIALALALVSRDAWLCWYKVSLTNSQLIDAIWGADCGVEPSVGSSPTQ